MAAQRKIVTRKGRNKTVKCPKTTEERNRKRTRRKQVEMVSVRDSYLRIVNAKSREKAKSVSTERRCNMQLLSEAARTELLDRMRLLQNAESSLKKDKKDYRILNRFELLKTSDSDDADKLIAKRKAPDQDVRYFVTAEESFDAIEEVHVSLGHAGIRRTHAKLTTRYANIPRHAVLTLLELCELCRRRRLDPLDKSQLRTRRLLKMKDRGVGQILATIDGRIETRSPNHANLSQEARSRFLEAIRGRSRETQATNVDAEMRKSETATDERRKNLNVHLLSAAVHDELVERLDQLRSVGDDVRRVRSDYRILQRYDVVEVGDEGRPNDSAKRKRLVSRRGALEEGTRYFVTTEECFEAIASIHMALGHAGINKTQAHLNLLYANIPRHAVITFIELCTECQLKKLRQRAAGATHGISTQNTTSGSGNDPESPSPLPPPTTLSDTNEADKETATLRHVDEEAAARVHHELYDLRGELESQCRRVMNLFRRVVRRKSRLRTKGSGVQRGNYNMHLLSAEAYEELVKRVVELRRAGPTVKKDRRDYRILHRFDILAMEGGTGGTNTVTDKRLIAKRTTVAENIRFFVTTDECFAAIHQAHATLDHAGIQKTTAALNRRYANIPRHAVEAFIRLCEDCKRHRLSPVKSPITRGATIGIQSSLTTTATTGAPKANSRLTETHRQTNDHLRPPELERRASISLLDMRGQPDDRHRWILVYRDQTTGFVVLRALSDRKPAEVADQLVDIFCQLGAPLVLEGNHDPPHGDAQFVVEVVRQVSAIWPACHLLAADGIHHGQPDPTCRIIALLEAWTSAESDRRWSQGLRYVQLQLNSTASEATKSPFELLLGTRPRLELTGDWRLTDKTNERTALPEVVGLADQAYGKHEGLIVTEGRPHSRPMSPMVSESRHHHRPPQPVEEMAVMQQASPLQYWPMSAMEAPTGVYLPACEQQQLQRYGWPDNCT